MLKSLDLNPDKYIQPSRDFIGRNVQNEIEEVDYVPKSHIRIWCNTQLEDYATHHHSALEVLMCMKNDYTTYLNDKKVVLHPGDILMIPPYMPHKLISHGEGMRFVFLLNLEPVNDFQDYHTISPRFMDPYLCSPGMPNYEVIYNKYVDMIHCYFENDVFWETEIFSIFFSLITKIGREFFKEADSNTSDTTAKTKEHYDKFASLLNYIDEHYAEDLSLDQVASYIGFSKFHFSRLFKEYTNTTFSDYLTKKRISEAEALLLENIPITDIAFQTGFNSLTTFCRSFKKVTTYSPSEYRGKSTQKLTTADFKK